jgi:hypothetical protein
MAALESLLVEVQVRRGGMANFGLTFLSRDALRRAEAYLLNEAQGVRDEIGFLIVHQRYADRFFPGTSVLHTRLRYVLFVAWMYEDLRREGRIATPWQRVQKEELKLVERLQNAGDGIIGIRTWRSSGRPTSQPPSFVYWTALATWGLLRQRVSGRHWTRAQVHQLLTRPAQVALDDDGQPISDIDLPFVRLPARPEGWESDTPLSFKLEENEREFLLERMRTVDSPEGGPSLLARLAGRPLPATPRPWSPPILRIAGRDEPALRRAGEAAALAAIGRAVYAAQAETLHEQDGRPSCRRLRDNLPKVIASRGHAASGLSYAEFSMDIGDLPHRVGDAVANTLEWVRGGESDPMLLIEAYRAAEVNRKGSRARLTDDLNGYERRGDWSPELHPLAEPLHYRWPNVQRLLQDLTGEA